jgi:hypothetical protein
MADQDHKRDPEAARAKLIELIKDGKWRITKRALTEGRQALRWLRGRLATDNEIVDSITQRLKEDFPLERIVPPDLEGVIWWAMNNLDVRGTYIKLQIAEDGVRDYALVLSCHPSVHKNQ